MGLQQSLSISRSFSVVPSSKNVIWNSFSIEGNVGSGKSTLLKEIWKRKGSEIPVIPEPTDSRWGKDDWVLKQFNESNSDGRWGYHSWKDCLSVYLRNRTRWFFTFQAEATEWYSMLGDLPELMQKNDGVTLIERSKVSSMIFSRDGYNEGHLNDWESDLLKRLRRSAFAPEGYIYLRLPPRICCARKNVRARKGEECTDLLLLEKFHVLHELAFRTPEQNREYLDGESNIELSDEALKYFQRNSNLMLEEPLESRKILILDGELPADVLADRVSIWLEKNIMGKGIEELMVDISPA